MCFREVPEAVWFCAGVALDVVIRPDFQAHMLLFSMPAASGDVGTARAYASSHADGNRHAAASYSWLDAQQQPPRACEAPVTHAGWNATVGQRELGVGQIPREPGAAGCCPRTDQAARRDSIASMARFAKEPLSVRKFKVFFSPKQV